MDFLDSELALDLAWLAKALNSYDEVGLVLLEHGVVLAVGVQGGLQVGGKGALVDLPEPGEALLRGFRRLP